MAAAMLTTVAVTAQVQPNYYTLTPLTTANLDYGDIVVHSGTSLTITAQNAKFGTITIAPSARLIIQGTTIYMRNKIIAQTGACDYAPNLFWDPFEAHRPAGSTNRCMGGELLVQNSTITADPSNNRTRWIGIELWGVDNVVPVSITEKGHAYITGSTITKANAAITTCRRDYVDKFGGAVRATNTRFINNDESVIYDGTPTAGAYPQYIPNALPPFQYQYELPLNGLEYFLRCTFDYNSAYIPCQGCGAKGHITLANNCKDIRILGCTFDDHYATTYRNCYGIVANNSDFTVSNQYNSNSIWGNNTQTAPSTFNNLWYGVLVYLMGDANRVAVLNSTFTNTNHSIHADGVFKPLFNGNNITVPQHQDDNELYDAKEDFPGGQYYANMGIAMYGCTGYGVENNTITSQANYPNTKTVGIYVSNSGPQANKINLNSASNASFNYYAMGWNYKFVPLDASVGLRFLCNSNAGSKNHDITVMKDPNSSVFLNGISGIQSNSTTSSAANTFAAKSASNFYNFYNQTGCRSIKYYKGSGLLGGNSDPVNRTSNVTVYNGSNVICRVRSAGPKFPLGVAWEGRLAMLEQKIGALSGMPNPDTTVVDTLQTYYDAYSDLADSVLNHYLYDDTTSVHYDSLAYALENMNLDYDYKLWLAGIYKSMLRYQDAIDLLGSVNEKFGLTGEDADRVNSLLEMYKILQKLFNNGNRWDMLSSEEWGKVQETYDHGNYIARSVAAALLHRYQGRLSVNPLIEPEEFGIISGSKILLQNNELKLYPVPAQKMLTVRWRPEDKAATAQLQITDLTGRLMLTVPLQYGTQNIDISRLASGMYLSTVKTATGKLIGQQKLVKE